MDANKANEARKILNTIELLEKDKGRSGTGNDSIEYLLVVIGRINEPEAKHLKEKFTSEVIQSIDREVSRLKLELETL